MNHPFEAVVLRYVHDPRTEEFLNIGVVVMSTTGAFAGARFLPQWGRVTGAFPGADPVLLRRYARAFERRCAEWLAGVSGQLSLEPAPTLSQLLGSVLHPDDATLTFSPLVRGITESPERTLSELFTLYVGHASETTARASREDVDVWRSFARHLANPALLQQLQRHVLQARHYEWSFDNAWKNGQWNVAQPLSLDLLEPRTIRDKATLWSGRILTLHPSQIDTHVFLLVGMPSADSPPSVREAANDALAILHDNLRTEASVLTEDESEKLARKIAEDLAAHPAAE